MTTELEKEFFKTFDIPPLHKQFVECKESKKWNKTCDYKLACIECEQAVFEDYFSLINTEKLVQLICVYTSINNIYRCCETVEELKELVLTNFIEFMKWSCDHVKKQDIYNKVREIFKIAILKDEV